MRSWSIVHRLALGLALPCALFACANEVVDDPDQVGALGNDGPSFAATVQPLFNQACNCHQSTPILMAPFSLKPGEAYSNMVGVPAMQLPSMALVKPGVLNDSYLWHKVNGTQEAVGGSGKIMPFTVPLNDSELVIIERWIAGGAQP
jgi:hypothetical protein